MYSKATVKVQLQPSDDAGKSPAGVLSKITTLIDSVRVGRETETLSSGQGTGGSSTLQLADYEVVVPHDRVPHIEVDLQVESSKNQRLNYLEVFKLAHGPRSLEVGNHQFGVDICWNQEKKFSVDDEREYIAIARPKQIDDLPVKIKMGPREHLTVEYTIDDDAMSFTEFIMALRSVLADHGDHEDILDRHKSLNLSSTRDHPLLPERRRHSKQPRRWIHVKLNVVEGKNKTSTTTLLMRDDNVYVLGFKNKEEQVYELQDRDNTKSKQILKDAYPSAQRLEWSVEYKSIMGVKNVDVVADKLAGTLLGYGFAIDAVRRLSCSTHPNEEVDGMISARAALVGLILMVCESARINHVLDFFARGWMKGKELDKELMRHYAWKGMYQKRSYDLKVWKRRNYAEPHPFNNLQAIYLVLNRWDKTKNNNETTRTPPRSDDFDTNNGSRGGGGNDQAGKDDRNSYGNPEASTSRKRSATDNSHNRPHKKARNVSSGEEARDAADSGGVPASQAAGGLVDAAGGGVHSDSQARGEARGPSQHEKIAAAAEGYDDRTSSEEQGDQSSSEEDGDETREDGKDQNDETDDDTPDQGRPLVEVLAMQADLSAIGKEIVVYDGKRGQIIFSKEEHEEQQQGGEMEDLALTGPYTGISADGSFAITIDVPGIEWEWDGYVPEYAAQVDGAERHYEHIFRTTDDKRKVAKVTYAVMSNALEASDVQVKLHLKDGHSPAGGDHEGNIRARISGFRVGSDLFTCGGQGVGRQCRFSRVAADSSTWLLQLARTVVAVPCDEELHIEGTLPIRTSNEVVKPLAVNLTFANGEPSAVQTNEDGDKVEVNITWYPGVKLKSGNKDPNINKFSLTAFLQAQDRDHLQRTAEVKTTEAIGEQHQAETSTAQQPSLEPKQTSIEISEQECITSDSREQSRPAAKAETSSTVQQQSLGPKQTSMEMSQQEGITSDSTEQSSPAKVQRKSPEEVVYPIGDELSFISFMMCLRRTLADHPDSGDILDTHHDPNLSSTREHPLLSKNRRGQPARWLHVTLQVASEEGRTEPPPSATLVIRDDNLYCLGFMNRNGDCYELSNPEGWKLPSEYNAKPLDWGVAYESILDVATEEDVVEILDSVRLGKTFAELAVPALSRFQPDHVADGIEPRLALAGLIVMVCESAKMNPLRDRFARGWNKGARFNDKLMQYIRHWELISIALLDWKDHSFRRWTIHPKLAEITGTKRPLNALAKVNLVRNFSMEERQLLWDHIYGII